MRTSNPVKITDLSSVKLNVRWQNTLNWGILNEGFTALAVSRHETMYEDDTVKSECQPSSIGETNAYKSVFYNYLI
jgi:hypothetical protein